MWGMWSQSPGPQGRLLPTYLMKSDALEMEQRRDFAGCRLLPGGWDLGGSGSQGSNCNVRKPSLLALLLHVARLLSTAHRQLMSDREGTAPQTALGALRGDMQDHCVLVSYVRPSATCPPPPRLVA